MALMEWQESLEAAIAREFQMASFQANRLLHQAGILPNQLPEFLKATSKIDAEEAEAISQHMMDLLMEAQNDPDAFWEEGSQAEQRPIMVQLVSMHLQLTDVEFADAASTMLRNRLRGLTAQLKTMKQTFRKKERELAIAQAEFYCAVKKGSLFLAARPDAVDLRCGFFATTVWDDNGDGQVDYEDPVSVDVSATLLPWPQEYSRGGSPRFWKKGGSVGGFGQNNLTGTRREQAASQSTGV